MHRVLAVLLVACAASQPAAVRPPPQPAPPRAPVAAAATAAPRPVEQVFADADPGFAFADPERRAKLASAFPAIDAAVTDEMKKQDLPGLALGIVIDGELAYAKGFGVTDLATKTTPDADTVYRIGSISKSFTGLAVLALRDDGALGLDDPLARWIPEATGLVYPSRDARPITLRQVLTHSSGLPRMGTFEPDHAPSEDAIVKSLTGLALETAPGTAWNYSNLGFSLLGIVAGHAAGMPLHDVVSTRILAPLGMTSTFWDRAQVPAGRLATAYEPAPTGPKPTDPIRLGAGDGAGGIYSSVRDMARYAAFQLSAYPPRNERDAGPLRRATVREAHSTGIHSRGGVRLKAAPKKGESLVELEAGTYGFGWGHAQTCDYDDIVDHGGGIDSYRSDLRFLTSHGVGVVVMSNFARSNPGQVASRVVEELARTGALMPRTRPLSGAFAPVMKAFLAVYNAWDEAALKAILSRPLDPREKDELAGYKQLHGACTSFAPSEVRSAFDARFKMTCERGSLDMGVHLANNGLIDGFLGTSRGVAPPPEIARIGGAIASLVARWDDAVYKRVLGRTGTTRDDARRLFDGLRASHAACKPGAFVHEGFDWRLELDCERGEALALELAMEGATLAHYNLHPAGTGACPVR